MSEILPTLYIARHGETARTVSGEHTGLRDLPLTERGQSNARRLGDTLRGRSFAQVFTSPLQRARRTCELAGLGDQAEAAPDLLEWSYGRSEGLRPAEIHATSIGWELFRDGCSGGESADDVGARADNVVGRVRAVQQDALIFSSRDLLRVLAARWLGLEPRAGKYFLLSTASLSALTYAHIAISASSNLE